MNFFINNNKCYFPNIPFYWYPLTSKSNIDFPDTLPFTLIYDEKLGLLRQEENKIVLQYLSEAYKKGSEITGLMDDIGIGKNYANDFMDFIFKIIPKNKIKDSEILEIGCGTGYLLNELHKLGGEVTGYEPGYSNIGKYDLPVFNTFFPTSSIKDKKYDCIIAYGVIEHIPNPVEFINKVKIYLKDDGILVVSVPDCMPYIKTGDLSMLLHEHYSYFTIDSLENLFEKLSFKILSSERANFGGSIYLAATMKNIPSDSSRNILDNKYIENITQSLNALRYFFESNKNKSIGIYVPIRILSSLYLLKEYIEKYNITIRFIDDNEGLHKKYLPTFDIPIENMEELISNPTEVILIMSSTFGQKITSKIREKLPGNTNVFLIDDLTNRW